MKDEDRSYLLHIRDAIGRILEYTASGRDEFHGNPMIQDAVIRNLEIIGEAVKKVSDKIRRNKPEIPWSRIAGMRDVLIHDYFGVNLETVWNVVQERLPALDRAVNELLASLE